MLISLRTFVWLGCALTLVPSVLLGAEANSLTVTLRDFEDPSEEPVWTTQNDGVMGGVSTGKAALDAGLLRFSGILSLENQGGFAQIYSLVEKLDLSEYSGVRIRVKGDGRVYQFRMATDARYRGSRIAYRSDFKTEAGKWTEVWLPFSSFSPSYRGNTLSGPPLDLTSIREIAFLLADKNPGPFSLNVDRIGLE